MNFGRIHGLSHRVMLQIARDRSTFVLLIIIPILLLVLADLLFVSDFEGYKLGVSNQDSGVSLSASTRLSLADAIQQRIEESEFFNVEFIEKSSVESMLAASKVKAVLVFPSDFTSSFLQSGEMVLDLKLEGSNPALSGTITGQINGIAIATVASIAITGALPLSPVVQPFLSNRTSDEQDVNPVTTNTEYFFGGEDFGVMDYVAPVYIAFLLLFFVFLITCVSLVRERTHGTMERLLATPASRLEIILGYMIGLGVYALMQGAIILLFSLFVLKIVYVGSLWLLFLIIVVLSITGVALGMLASSFARNEFQVVQFIPLLMIPQMLLGGTFTPVEDLPRVLKPIAFCMPLTYANIALRDVMIKGWGFAEIYPNIIILIGFAILFILIDVLAVRREFS